MAIKAREILAENATLRARILELEGVQGSGGSSEELSPEGPAADSALGSGNTAKATRPTDLKEPRDCESDTTSKSNRTKHPSAGVLVDESQRHISDLNWEAILDDVNSSFSLNFLIAFADTKPR